MKKKSLINKYNKPNNKNLPFFFKQIGKKGKKYDDFGWIKKTKIFDFFY